MKFVSILIFCGLSVPALAFDLASGLMAPEQQKILLNYTGIVYGEAENDPDKLTAQVQNFSALIPLYKNTERAFALTASSNQFTLSSSRAGLKTLTDTRFGFSYTEKVDDKRTWSANVQYGSASDKPFENSSVSTINATAMYMTPRDETSSWMFVVNYSNNRPFLNNIPIPGFAYFYFPDKDFRAVYGLPFASIYYKFHEKWSTDLFTLLPWIYRGSFNYHLNGFARIYTGFHTGPETWYLHDRTNRRERLFYDEKRLFIGLKSPIARFLMGEIEGGRSFDRRFFNDENFSLSPEQSASVGSAYYLRLSLRAFF